MGTELAKAYVQIVPSARGIKGKISEQLGSEGDSAGKMFGANMAGAIKGVIAAAGICNRALEELKPYLRTAQIK